MGIKTTIYVIFLTFNFFAISCSDGGSSDSVVEDISNPLYNNESDEETGNVNIDDADQTLVYEILPMGDSRVQGDRPDDESYRFELWKLLLDREIRFDFVGTKKDLADYPEYQNIAFDTDHEGTGGATTTSILAELDEILKEIDPDIVLLGIGGNDLDDGATVNATIANINRIVDKIQAKNDKALIIVEQIAPAVSSYMTIERTAVLEEFNNAISNMAQNQTTPNSMVVPVNMFDDWKDEYFADDVHYNAEGAKEVARRYFQVIDSLLLEE